MNLMIKVGDGTKRIGDQYLSNEIRMDFNDSIGKFAKTPKSKNFTEYMSPSNKGLIFFVEIDLEDKYSVLQEVERLSILYNTEMEVFCLDGMEQIYIMGKVS